VVGRGGGTGRPYNGWRVSWIPAFAGMTIVSLRDGVFNHGQDALATLRLEVIEFGVFVVEVLDVGGDGEGLVGGLLD